MPHPRTCLPSRRPAMDMTRIAWDTARWPAYRLSRLGTIDCRELRVRGLLLVMRRSGLSQEGDCAAFHHRTVAWSLPA